MRDKSVCVCVCVRVSKRVSKTVCITCVSAQRSMPQTDYEIKRSIFISCDLYYRMFSFGIDFGFFETSACAASQHNRHRHHRRELSRLLNLRFLPRRSLFHTSTCAFLPFPFPVSFCLGCRWHFFSLIRFYWNITSLLFRPTNGNKNAHLNMRRKQ